MKQDIEKHFWSMYGWAIDFCRGVYGMNKLQKFIFRVILGRYVWREFVGLVQLLDEHDCTFEYGLESCDYHKDGAKLELW